MYTSKCMSEDTEKIYKWTFTEKVSFKTNLKKMRNMSSEDAYEHFRKWECRNDLCLSDSKRMNLSISEDCIRKQCETVYIQWSQFSKNKK